MVFSEVDMSKGYNTGKFVPTIMKINPMYQWKFRDYIFGLVYGLVYGVYRHFQQ